MADTGQFDFPTDSLVVPLRGPVKADGMARTVWSSKALPGRRRFGAIGKQAGRQQKAMKHDDSQFDDATLRKTILTQHRLRSQR